MSLHDPKFRYTSAADTAKPGYLHRKWLRLYPNCFKPEKPVAATVTPLLKAAK